MLVQEESDSFHETRAQKTQLSTGLGQGYTQHLLQPFWNPHHQLPQDCPETANSQAFDFEPANLLMDSGNPPKNPFDGR